MLRNTEKKGRTKKRKLNYDEGPAGFSGTINNAMLRRKR